MNTEQLNGFYNVIQKTLIVINARLLSCARCSYIVPTSMEENKEDNLMEDAVLYLQKKTYRVGASKNEKAS